jgi:biotin transport system substrate-specific component
MNAHAAHTLADRIWLKPQDGASLAWRRAALVLCGVALLTASAKAQLPMVPVPMTMQSAVVLLIAVGFGLRLATATVASYLGLGFLGAPVFAGAVAGPLYFAGPTGGFLVGFLMTAAAIGALADRGWSRDGKLLFALALGTVLPFVSGWAWLSLTTGASAAFAAGVLPFIPGALLKLALAFLLLTVAQRAAKR